MRVHRRHGGLAGAFLAVIAVVGCAAAPASPSPVVSGTDLRTSAPSTTAPTPRPTISPSPTPEPTPKPGTADLSIYGLPELDDLLVGVSVSTATAGPNGFVVLGNDRRTDALVALTSVDGDRWVRTWLPGTYEL